MPLRASSPGRFCRVTAFRLRLTERPSLQGIRATFGYQGDNREGILLERVLPNLNLPIQSSTYELL